MTHTPGDLKRRRGTSLPLVVQTWCPLVPVVQNRCLAAGPLGLVNLPTAVRPRRAPGPAASRHQDLAVMVVAGRRPPRRRRKAGRAGRRRSRRAADRARGTAAARLRGHAAVSLQATAASRTWCPGGEALLLTGSVVPGDDASVRAAPLVMPLPAAMRPAGQPAGGPSPASRYPFASLTRLTGLPGRFVPGSRRSRCIIPRPSRITPSRPRACPRYSGSHRRALPRQGAHGRSGSASSPITPSASRRGT